MENLNLLFYKTFYTKLGNDTWFDETKKITVFEHDITVKSNRLVDSKFYPENYKGVCEAIDPKRFLLKTVYPGLLIGTGYAHGVDSDSDIKIGFSFDFVTGQPYIPGSSVKGLLRSYFAHPEVVTTFLNDENINVKALENSIFGTQDEVSDDGVDVFFDAVIKRGDEKGRVMGYDAITPHGTDLTKNPVPIKILKVLPDVAFEFSFKLKDSVIDGKTVTAAQKLDLFEQLLITFGIGAKTNVGYGVLIPVKENELNPYPQKIAKTSENTTDTNRNNDRRREAEPVTVSEISGNEQPAENHCYNCTVTGVKEFGVFVKIDSTKISGLIHVSKLGVPRGVEPSTRFSVGDKVVAKFLYSKDNKLSFAFVSER